MSGLSDLNRFRWGMILLSREAKALFMDGDRIKRSGEALLADLRTFCWVDRPTIFSKDAIEMARREGRREVFVRLQKLLNLDEAQVQQLMEIDDGL